MHLEWKIKDFKETEQNKKPNEFLYIFETNISLKQFWITWFL